MLPHAVHAMLADMLPNPTRTQKQRKSCDVTHSGYETPEQEVTKVQDWVSKHGISSAENKAGQMGLMLADEDSRWPSGLNSNYDSIISGESLRLGTMT